MTTRYQQVADHISDQIKNGLLRAGEKVPSVRQCSAEMGLSISSVIRGYELLQDQMLIEPRPQSGFYVRPQFERNNPPAISKPTAEPSDVNIDSLAVTLMQTTQDENVIQLGTAPPFTDVPSVKALNRIMTKVIREEPNIADYDTPAGNEDLRRQIARRMINAGVNIHPDEIVITTGCQEAITLCLRAVTKAGDTVIVESPSYFGTLKAIESLGLKVLEIPTHAEKGVSLSAIQDAIAQWDISACVLTPNFSNPLGYVMSDEKKSKLRKLLKAADVPIIEDDIYAELSYNAQRPKAIKAFDETCANSNVLLCSSLSKSLSPGLRIGWAIPGRWLNEVTQLKVCNSMAGATVPAKTAARYLELGIFDRHLRQMRRHYKDQRDYFLHLATLHLPKNIRLTHPEGGYVIWLELEEHINSMKLYEDAKYENISIAPGPLFSVSGEYKNFIRINYGRATKDQLEEAMIKLGRIISNS
ncbi:PLP-dependent aminotransferase family protein [uncultured Cocleimonas sp.]|uniref:aminotransferase-like domain-containing protein n=1 Tax=uncultured Cocleimonas sp. TaxID=1051587 RepID=UPI00261ED875|nr:PLP-dependent aminotransferase family protein [uncultured Cocleimonas sp.]